MNPSYMHRLSGLAVLACLLFAPACEQASSTATMETAPERLSVLLVSGQNNHAWEETNVLLQGVFADAGIFDVTTSLTPPKESPAEAWDTWRPDFASYDAVVMDYNGEMWPDEVKASFEAYVSGGGGVVAVHASNNPFPGWTAFEQMIGMLWRRPDAGTTVYLEDDGTPVRMGPGEGPRAGHGVLHDWQIHIRDTDHPVTRGLPQMWLHPHDELYHGQRGPAENMNVLASAYSDPESRGTGNHELMVWWIPFGEGKVLTFLPGHHWNDQEDERAFMDVGFRTMLNRSIEWVATDEVTIPVPDNFPTADQISLVAAP